MSVIAILGVPKVWTLRRLVINIANCIRRQFEGLGFSDLKGNTKTGYIRLPQGSRPSATINMINRKKFKAHHMIYTFRASVSKNPPFFNNKVEQVPAKTLKHLRMPVQRSHGDDLLLTHNQLLTEIQSVYTELYTISLKTNHKLLKNISQTIFERLMKFLKKKKNTIDFSNAFELSLIYRRSHPHDTDINLIESELHKIQDETGQPRTQLCESNLIKLQHELLVNDNMPWLEVDHMLQKYSDKIMSTLRGYIASIQDEIDFDYWSEEDAPRKRVREELLKMPKQIEGIVEDVIFEDFKTRTLRLNEPIKIMMYGIPFLPSKEGRIPILNPNGANQKTRGDLYNLMLFAIPRRNYSSLMEFDGKVIEGSTIHIRQRSAPLYQMPQKALNAMKNTVKNLSYC